MSKRAGSWFGLLGLLVAACIIAWFAYNGGTYTAVFTADEVQQRIDAVNEQREASEPKGLHVGSAHVVFVEGRVLIDVTLWDVVKGRLVQVDAHAEGSPEYRGGAFYFHPTGPVRFTHMKIEREGSGGSHLFARTTEVFREKFAQFVAKHQLEDLTAAFKADFDEWVSAKAQKKLTAVLTRHPIYTLKNTLPGIAIRAVLDKVEVVDGTLHITLSLAQFGYSIFLAVTILLIAIVIGALMVTNPEWGVPIVFFS